MLGVHAGSMAMRGMAPSIEAYKKNSQAPVGSGSGIVVVAR